jgi:hypothetical protein
MDDQRTNRASFWGMSRGFKIFLIVIIGFAVWINIADSLAMYVLQNERIQREAEAHHPAKPN